MSVELRRFDVTSTQYDSTVTSENQIGPDVSIASAPEDYDPGRVGLILTAIQIFVTGLTTYIVIAICSTAAIGYSEGLQLFGIALASTPLTVLAFLVGLPLRLAPRARRWWREHTSWFLALLGLAVVCILLSYVVGDAGPIKYDEADWPLVDGYVPEWRLLIPSLALMAFATMHLRLPPRRRHQPT
ncbi:hypothetical protein ACLD0U_14375 [Microbacterium sp. 2216-1]|uniref:hypothetical protein n=1 Tax=Microbacterium sp. 2216-1 TaxID=3390053 RepID=UPI003974F4CF